MENILKNRKNELEFLENNLSPFACKSSDAIRFNSEEPDFRLSFARDADRIIHSLSYTRSIGKTQVYSYIDNDHISKRMIHVQLVGKISRTIGRYLNLNEDLLEAIAIGHDIGHSPLGHEGEKILNEICLKEGIGIFKHNIQGVRILRELEYKGTGTNISLQVLDGIMCHTGEFTGNICMPRKKTKEEFLNEYSNILYNSNSIADYTPMTLEGAVVKIADTIAYVGRDIEDAINVGQFKREELPEDLQKILGNSNKSIISNLIADVIENSIGKKYIAMSEEKMKLFKKLIDFNMEKIYFKANNSEERESYRLMINNVYSGLLNEYLNTGNDSYLYKNYLHNMSEEYLNKTDNRRIVIDFIASMTDNFLLKTYQKMNELQ